MEDREMWPLLLLLIFFVLFCFIVTKRKDVSGLWYLPYTLTTHCIFLGQRCSIPTHRSQRKHHIVSLLQQKNLCTVPKWTSLSCHVVAVAKGILLLGFSYFAYKITVSSFFSCLMCFTLNPAIAESIRWTGAGPNFYIFGSQKQSGRYATFSCCHPNSVFCNITWL
jgi:uncharacterized membrane protein YhdT